MLLFHGSKGGIRGAIKPISRPDCDFGSGFYMGDLPEQPLTLVCSYATSKFYKLAVNTEGLSILTLERTLDWALLVAYYRGHMEHLKGTAVYRHYSEYTSGYDLVSGLIADDRMYVVLERYFDGDITDETLVKCLSALKLGTQWVAKTPRACQQIHIVEELPITEEYRQRLLKASEKNRGLGVRLADGIISANRRSTHGKYFDELLEGFR